MELAPAPRRALLARGGLLTAGFYGALFFAFGAHLPYWPVWLRDWGLTEAEIGTYVGLALAVRVVSATLVPALADRFALRRAFLAAGGALGAAVFLAHLLIGSREALLAATLIAAFAVAPLNPLGEALGIRAAARHGFAYAHVRAVGSLAFLAMNVGLGAALAHTGPQAILWAVAANLALVALFGALHPGGGAPPGTGLDRARLGEAAGLLGHPVFLTFAVAASVGQASHAVYYAYGTLAWLNQGIGTATIGMLWATGVLAEIALMLGPGRRLVERIGPARALMAAGAAGVLRWPLMSLAPPVALLWPVQSLHAVTFAVGHLGAIAFVAAAVPPRLQASAQGLFAGGLGGAAFALATLAAGAISAAASPSATYWLAAAMSAAALAAAFRLSKTWDGGLVAPAQT